MPFVCPNHVFETTTVTLTGAATLLGPSGDFLDFDSQLADGDTVPYTIEHGAEKEVGIGTFSTTGPTLTRTTILYSTNGGAAVNFTAGTKNIYSGLAGEIVSSLVDQSAGNGLVVQTATNTYERQPVTTSLDSSISWICVTDPAYGATGDGVTNDSTAIQAAIDAAELVPGGRVIFPPAAYNIGSTGLVVLGDGITLEGVSPRFVGASLFGTELLYSGTGVAVTFGSSAKDAHYRNRIGNLQIRATGAAIASGTAIGCQLINQHYLASTDLAIKDFTAGIGLQFKPLNDGTGFGALNSFENILVHLCHIGIDAVSVSAFTKENAATFYGGTTICDNSAGSVGLQLDQFADAFTFYSTDFESAENNCLIDGRGTRFIGTRTEFQTTWGIWCTANALRTAIIAHQWSGSPSDDSDTFKNDGGPTNYRLDERGFYNMPQVKPVVDGTEVFTIAKAGGLTTILDVSTDATPRIDVLNACDFNVYSDAFTTLVASIDGATGKIEGKKLKAAGDITELVEITKADGTTFFDLSATGANPTVEVVNSADVLGWSDNFSTLKWKITGASGDIKGVTLTASGTAIGVGSGEISIGANTATTVGAAGGAAALPLTPLGYINCYVGGTPVKIPYYSN